MNPNLILFLKYVLLLSIVLFLSFLVNVTYNYTIYKTITIALYKKCGKASYFKFKKKFLQYNMTPTNNNTFIDKDNNCVFGSNKLAFNNIGMILNPIDLQLALLFKYKLIQQQKKQLQQQNSHQWD